MYVAIHEKRFDVTYSAQISRPDFEYNAKTLPNPPTTTTPCQHQKIEYNGNLIIIVGIHTSRHDVGLRKIGKLTIFANINCCCLYTVDSK